MEKGREVASKYTPKTPKSAERDYERMINEMLRETMRPVLRENLPELLQIMKEAEIDPDAGEAAVKMDARQGKQSKKNQEERSKVRLKNLAKSAKKIEDWFQKVAEEITAKLGIFDLADKLDKAAKTTETTGVRELKKAVQKTIGADLFDDVFDGDFFKEQTQEWIAANVSLIKTLPDEMLENMRKTVMEAYTSGTTITDLSKQINCQYGVTKSHAKLLARDQIAKLNCDITKHEQTSCGITKYKWSSSNDSRVRKDHRVLDGKIFSWDDPPLIGNTGRRCHPGQDYQCRCCAIPVFDMDALEIPVKTTEERKYGYRS